MKDCAVFDEVLLYVPKIGSCRFQNIEFDTNLNFNANGRVGNIQRDFNNNEIIISTGDSMAMGWGVEDNETYSALLENKLYTPVLNLGVSSYGTSRELAFIIRNKYFDESSIIILQYSNNDISENAFYLENDKYITNPENFAIIQSYNGQIDVSFFKYILQYTTGLKNKIVDYISSSFLSDKDQIKAKRYNNITGKTHAEIFVKVLESFEILRNKKIIVLELNSHNKKIDGFLTNIKSNILDLNSISVDLDENDFFILDGHLNNSGHEKVSKSILTFLKSIRD